MTLVCFPFVDITFTKNHSFLLTKGKENMVNDDQLIRSRIFNSIPYFILNGLFTKQICCGGCFRQSWFVEQKPDSTRQVDIIRLPMLAWF